jgi:hypothetical protein
VLILVLIATGFDADAGAEFAFAPALMHRT